MKHFLGVAKEKGVTDEEIGAVESIVMAIAAGKIDAQLREIQTQAEKQENKN